MEISPEETAALAGQLTRIVEHFEALRSIPDAELEAAPDPGATPLRVDRPADPLDHAYAKRNAPEFAHGHFVVPKVVSRGD